MEECYHQMSPLQDKHILHNRKTWTSGSQPSALQNRIYFLYIGRELYCRFLVDMLPASHMVLPSSVVELIFLRSQLLRVRWHSCTFTAWLTPRAATVFKTRWGKHSTPLHPPHPTPIPRMAKHSTTWEGCAANLTHFFHSCFQLRISTKIRSGGKHSI